MIMIMIAFFFSVVFYSNSTAITISNHMACIVQNLAALHKICIASIQETKNKKRENRR